MAKRKKKASISIQMGLKDERFPKLIGLFCLFLTLYLFIAFTSYLFTWQQDMDKASHMSILLTPQEMHNWLGRLGAFLSHQFFYWGFGFPSFIFVFMLFTTGMSLIVETPVKRLYPLYRKSLVLILLSSFMFAFLFQSSEFPWGGAFGKLLVTKLNSFVGTIGILAILIFLFLSAVVWIKNPNFNEWTADKLKDTFRPSNFIAAVKQLVAYISPMPKRMTASNAGTNTTTGNKVTNKQSEQTTTNTTTNNTTTTNTPPENTTKEVQTLRPRGLNKKSPQDDENPEENTDAEAASDAPRVLDTSTKEELEEKVKRLTKGQLSLDLSTELEKRKKARKEKAKTSKDGELEIEVSDQAENIRMSITEENSEHVEPYDPTLDLPKFENPVLDLLESYDDQKPVIDRAELEANKDQIIETLLNYKIEIVKIKATIGPTVTLYEIVPAPGVRISKIKNLEDDIALSLAALGIRIIAPIPGKGTIGIEVPNRNKQIVSLKEVLASDKFKYAKMDLPIVLGRTISNEVFIADLAKMPHLLIAGATGQGKSVGINTIIMSLLYKKHPSQLKLVLIDPKKVELSLYNALSNHYLGFMPGEDEAIVTDTAKVVQTLHSLTVEMDERYNLLKKASVRNLKEYNQKFVKRRLNPEKGHKFLPYIVLIVDEFADMIMTAGKEVELPIGRLAQLARAVGIHLIIATQRPSVNIITGVIKANFPARLAFKVTSKIDSRTILDSGGAEQLIGRGDMLLSTGGDVVRLQCAFIDTPEVERVIEHIEQQSGYPEPFLLPAYGSDDENDNRLNNVLNELDENFEDAARLVVINQQGSTSMLQRRLKLGYNRAGRLMDQLEHTGIVGPHEGSKARQVYIHDEIELEEYLKTLREKRNKSRF